MLSRMILIPLAILAAWTGPSPDPNVSRGTYYQDKDHGFEIWIPRGYARLPKESRKVAEVIACFSGGINGGSSVDFLKPEKMTISKYIKRWNDAAKKRLPGCEIETIRDVDACGHKAVILWHKNLDGTEAYKGREFFHAGVPMGDGSVMDVLMYLKAGKGESALEEMRWMLGTIRYTGNAGLDAYLCCRRVDKKTGICFRPPKGFIQKKVGIENSVYVGVEKEKDFRLELCKTDEVSLEAVIESGKNLGKQTLDVWKIQLPGEAALQGTFYTSGDQGWAQVAVKVKKNVICCIKCFGKKSPEEPLLRTAELVGLNLDFIDIQSAAEEAKTAIAALESAMSRKDSARILAQIKILIRYPFLNRVSTALIKNLPKMKDEKHQVAVAEALATQSQPDLSSALLNVARNGRIRKNPVVLAAVLKTLGASRCKKAISLLHDHAKRGENRVAAAAILALGHYAEHRKRVIRKLVKLMIRAEKDGNKGDFAARERWELLLPAYQTALLNLTGESFRTAAEADIWAKQKKI